MSHWIPAIEIAHQTHRLGLGCIADEVNRPHRFGAAVTIHLHPDGLLSPKDSAGWSAQCGGLAQTAPRATGIDWPSRPAVGSVPASRSSARARCVPLVASPTPG